MATDKDRRRQASERRQERRGEERGPKQARGPQQARERRDARQDEVRERKELREREQESGRGRHAERPTQITAAGWRDVAMRVKEQFTKDNVSLVGAGVGLYGLLALFPALAAAVSLYGIFASPEQVADQMEVLTDVLPEQGAEIIGGQLENLTQTGGGALGFGLIVGFLVALWSARQGMTALMIATNIAYNEQETRSFVKQLLVSLALTLGAVVGFVVIVLLGVVTPVALAFVGLGDTLEGLLAVLRWAVLWVLVVLGISVIYRYAPDRAHPQWRWVNWGSAIAATLWLLGSLAFALYVSSFGAYGETYGAIGGVIVLLLWFYLSGVVVVLGAEINAELEHQTAYDTTQGDPHPMGQRGAEAADTLGPSP